MKRILSLVFAAVLSLSVFTVNSAAVNYIDSYPNTHKNTGGNLEDLIAVAKTQIGYTELSTSTGKALQPTQNGGYTKYGAWFGAPTTAWCAFFVAWCSNQANISTNIIPRIGNCAAMVSWYSQRGRYHAASGFEPRTGDLIFYNWQGASTAKHIGVVTGVSGNNVYTIEGNTGSAHGYRAEAKTRRKNAKYIIGYARPGYNDAKTYIGSYSFAEYAAMKYKSASASYTANENYSYSGSSTLAVFTGAVSHTGASSATVNGRVINSSKYAVSSAGFYFGSSKSSMSAYKTCSYSKSKSITLSADISSRRGELKAGETYYYCAYAVIKGKTYKGPVYSFKATDDTPQIVAISREELKIAVGETYEIYSALLPLDSKDKGIQWSSDNEYVATVDQNGLVTGVSSGNAVITAKSKYGQAYSQCKVTVTLAPVIKIEAENISPSEIQIKWFDDDPDDLFGYEVYRGGSLNGEYIKIADCSKSTDTFTDSSLKSGESYYYKIVSKGITQEFDSNLSQAVSQRALIAKGGITGISQSGIEIKIKFRKVDFAKEYLVFRSSQANNRYQLIGTCSTPEYIDRDITAGEKYYYKVAASDGVAVGDMSDYREITASKMAKISQDELTNVVFGEFDFNNKERIFNIKQIESVINNKIKAF